MKKGNVKEFFGELLQVADKNSPALLTGCVCAGVIGSVLLAWFNAPKAKEVVSTYKKEVEDLTNEYLDETGYHHLNEIKEPKTEAAYEHNKVVEEYKEKKAEATAKMVFGVTKNVAPVVVLGGATIACAIGANTVSSKRIAALSAAYSISEKALSEFQSKTTELIGEKKVEEVKKEIAGDKLAANPVSNDSQIVMTGAGDVLCYDTYSGRYFKSSPSKIRDAVNRLNDQLMKEYYISLNEFYYMIGLPNVKLGYDLGFCIDSGLVEMRFSYKGEEETENPTIVLNYDISPKYKENKMMG